MGLKQFRTNVYRTSLKTPSWGESLRIQSECGKIPTTKTRNTDTFQGVVFTKYFKISAFQTKLYNSTENGEEPILNVPLVK